MNSNKKGFTLVELLVVLLIIAILAAVATPLYLQNAQRARASEAVAVMSLIRQAQRDFQLNSGSYYDIAANGTAGNIQNPAPSIVVAATGAPTPPTAGAGIPSEARLYYSNSAFTVAAVNPAADTAFTNPDNPQGFLVYADGSATNYPCLAADTNCATKGNLVNGNGVAANSIDLKMDNAGRIFVSYDGGTTWGAY